MADTCLYLQRSTSLRVTRKDSSILRTASQVNLITQNLNSTIMRKIDIVANVAKKTSLPREEVVIVIDGFMNEVRASLSKNESVFLRGFGTFLMKRRAQKIARNISAGTSVVVPERSVPAFKPSKDFISK